MKFDRHSTNSTLSAFPAVILILHFLSYCGPSGDTAFASHTLKVLRRRRAGCCFSITTELLQQISPNWVHTHAGTRMLPHSRRPRSGSRSRHYLCPSKRTHLVHQLAVVGRIQNATACFEIARKWIIGHQHAVEASSILLRFKKKQKQDHSVIPRGAAVLYSSQIVFFLISTQLKTSNKDGEDWWSLI